MKAPQSELWHRVEPILERALELVPESRAAYLEEACAGDGELRREVEVLLVADREAEDFLSGAVGDVAGSVLRQLDSASASSELAPGQAFGRYRSVRRLGHGGMGVVYEALDPELGRRVALKLLPPDWTDEPERLHRFEREARAVAALNHPSIVTIYSVERFEDTPFFSMELVEGRTLDEIIPTGGMPLEDFLELAVRLADALRAAHEKGLVHRDLKPANVMVTGDRRPKILDFGLVKQQPDVPDGDASEAETMTLEGKLLGTVPYMSPEQARGEIVDVRTDVFSLGVLFYEMLTGRRPFQGETPAGLLAAIIKDVPSPLEEQRSDLPTDLGDLLRRCLEKEPGRRSITAKDVRDELDRLRRQREAERFLADSGAATSPESAASSESKDRRLLALAGTVVVLAVLLAVLRPRFNNTPAPAPPTTNSSPSVEVGQEQQELLRIVVLPFMNQGLPEDVYLTAGVSEEITSYLTRVGGLAVISSTSARAYAGTDKDVAQIGRELKVKYILEGTVSWERRQGARERVRVMPRLIRVADDINVWTDIFDRDWNGILAVQSEIAEQVAHELGATLLPAQRDAIQARPTDNLNAYHAYLRAEAYLHQMDGPPDAVQRAIENFKQANALDPEFVAPLAKLSQLYSTIYGRHKDLFVREEAQRTLKRAQELAPDHVDVRLAEASFLRVCRRFDEALEVLESLNQTWPNHPDVLKLRGAILLHSLGRWDEELGLDLYRKAADLDPNDLWLQGRLAAFVLLPLERYAEAMKVCDRAIALGPNNRPLYDTKAYIYWTGTGDVERARIALAALPAEDPFSKIMDTYQRIFDGDYQAALESVSSISSEWFNASALGEWPVPLWKARIYELLQEPALAAASYETSLKLTMDELQQRPDDPMVQSVLGYTYAGLGRKEEAIQAGKRAVKLDTNSKSIALERPWYIKHLAAIYTRVGEYEKALDELDRLLSTPTEQISVPLMELEPWWEPLRDHPRYSELVRKYGHESD